MDTVEEDFKRSGFNNWKAKAVSRTDGEASLGLSSLEQSCCTDVTIHVKYLLFWSDINEA